MWEFHLSNNVIACDSAASNLTAQKLKIVTLNLPFFRKWLSKFQKGLVVLFMTLQRRLCRLQRRLCLSTEVPAEETVLPAEVAESKSPASPADVAESKSPAEAPAEVAEVPEVPAEGTEPPAEETVEQPGGIFKNIDPVAFQQKQKELKEKILADIEERSAKIESEKMAQQEAEQAALQAPPEEPEDPVGPGLDKAAPFNAFGGTALANKVKEELADSDEEENENLVLQDLRWCISCKSKSYVRQGLCINLYCKLYYMSRAVSGTR